MRELDKSTMMPCWLRFFRWCKATKIMELLFVNQLMVWRLCPMSVVINSCLLTLDEFISFARFYLFLLPFSVSDPYSFMNNSFSATLTTLILTSILRAMRLYILFAHGGLVGPIQRKFEQFRSIVIWICTLLIDAIFMIVRVIITTRRYRTAHNINLNQGQQGDYVFY